MKNFRSNTFSRYFDTLPSKIQKLAQEKFEQFKKNPDHPGLRRKKTSVDDLWEVRVNIHYRAIYEKAVDKKTGEPINRWLFIGPKPEFEKFLKLFRKR